MNDPTGKSSAIPAAARPRWMLPVVVGALVLVAQLWLVAHAGTDVPFQDQWDVEGRWLYPAATDGTLHFVDLLRPHNEHRLLWTHLLNLGLFSADGQWDPLVQMAAIAVLRAGCAGLLVGCLARGWSGSGRWWVAAGAAVAFLPHLAWHNVLWGFQSQVYFSLGFSLVALILLGADQPSWWRVAGGLAAGVAAQLGMGAGAFVPLALLGWIAVRTIERRRWSLDELTRVWPALLLLGLAWLLRTAVPEHEALRAATAGQFLTALGRALAWPHVGQPFAAAVCVLPLAGLLIGRLAGWRKPRAGEDVVVLIGLWALAGAGAQAWLRGGSDEFAAGVPSRYVDFLILLPLACAWSAAALAVEADGRWRRNVRVGALAWIIFMGVGWVGLSAETLHSVVLPRWRDREAPVRLMVKFQATNDPRVFEGQPRLYVPHPNLESVRAVLNDPRMRGRLPPSLQPERPMGPLSRAVRGVLRQ
jgi:uncharacterized membrane protein